MGFAGMRPQPERCSNGSFRQGKTLRSMIETQGIKGIVCKGELALGGKKRRVARKRLIQQIDP